MAKKGKDDKKDEASDGTIAVNDAWTGMLAVSLLALVVGSGFLAYDYFSLYNSDVPPPTPMKVTGGPPAPPPKAAPAPAPGPAPADKGPMPMPMPMPPMPM
ncbi:MAG TPA: hypothetical protein VFE62_06755 [Gemmataceae bacterium]|nr:hypothetical protein [Gemmataceae bacterium]